jgi:hypothetical protein
MALEEEEAAAAIVVNMENIQHVSDPPRLQGQKQLSLPKFPRKDSLDIESRTTSHSRHSKVRLKSYCSYFYTILKLFDHMDRSVFF